MRRLLITLLCVLSFQTLLLAQTRQLTGSVVDATGAGIVAATVNVKGKNTATSTNAEGQFSITVPTGDVTLEVSSVGYATQTVKVGTSQSNIAITLQQASTDLSEVVVTALGIKKEKRALGYAITEVKGDELTRARSNNVMQSLIGKVPGLNVVGTATGAGGSSRVVMRGNTSLTGENQPLYVVDGIPIDNSNRGSAGEWGGRDAGDGIQMINPDEIESMTVLKGGAAAALYGSRSTGGVILITTKKGSKRKGLGIEINSNLAMETVMKLSDWQYEYGHGINGKAPANAEEAAGLNFNSWGGKLDGSNVFQFDGIARAYVAQKNNLQKFYSPGTNFNNSVTLYGGSDKMTYNFNIGDMHNKSIVPNSKLARNNFGVNLAMTPVDKLTVNLSARYIRERATNRPKLSDSPGNPNFTVSLMPTSLDVATFKTSKIDPATGGERKFNGNPYVTNPYWATYDFHQEDARDRMIGSIEARYNFTNWLYTRARVGTDMYTRYDFTYTPVGTQYSPGGQINNQSTERFRETNGELLLGVQKDLTQKLSLDAFVAGNLMQNITSGQYFWGDNFFTKGFYHISNLKDKSSDYGYTEFRVNSAYFSTELSYNKYLFLTVSGRNDWYSTLPATNRSLFYPSVGLSAIISDMVTMPEAINYAKVRTSWSKVGGQRDPYSLNLLYGLNSNSYNAYPVGSISGGTIPNRNLLPYKVITSEVGLEAKLFKSRLNIDFSVYDRNTIDDIVKSNVTITSGYNELLLNVGKISNKGIELMINGVPYKTDKFQWDVTLNYTHNKSTVVKISEQNTELQMGMSRSMTAFIKHIEGQAYGQVMGYDFKRNASGQLLLKDGVPQRGEFKSFGSGVSPNLLGITNAFRYGNFNFEFLIDGRFGGMMYSGTNDFATYRGLHKNTLVGRVGGITADGIDEATQQKNTKNVDVQTYNQSIGLNITAPFIYKSDFIKLRQVIFAYNLPEGFITKTPFKGASISLVGRNLAILKKYVPNIDPESTYNSGNAQGLEWYGVPAVRSIGLNLNLRF